MRLFLSVFALVFLFVLGVNGICKDSNVDHNFKFVTKGKVCDGTIPTAPVNSDAPLSERGCTLCCKNFLSCLPANSSDLTLLTCQEIGQNSTCTPGIYGDIIGPCGAQLECLEVAPGDNRCLMPGILENGAVCLVDEQCLSNICTLPPASTSSSSRLAPSSNNTKYCQPTGAVNGYCETQTDCPFGQWCNVTANNCTKPIKIGGDCSSVAGYYDDLLTIPNFVCQSGSGCLKSTSAKGTVRYTCTAYYESSNKNSVCYASQWWNCEFGFYCNITNAVSGEGTCQITNQNGAIGDTCSYFPLSSGDMQECYWGTGCSCFDGSKTTATKGKCNRMYNTNCQIQLENLVDCIKKSYCPHDSYQLLGGNPSPFADSTVLGSCIQTKCPHQHANLLQCQNDIDNPTSPVSSAFVPTTYPNNAVSKDENGLQGWEIGLIIVGVAVTIIIFVVIVVAFVRQRADNGYTTLE